MEPLTSLKRCSMVDFTSCIICQSDKSGDLRAATEHSLAIIKDITDVRKKLRDIKYRDVIERLDEIIQSDTSVQMFWHRGCYAQYTDKGKLERLRKKMSPEDPFPSCSHQTESQKLITRRSGFERMNWQLCMFCQEEQNKKRLISVSTFKMSQTILQAAPLGHISSSRL